MKIKIVGAKVEHHPYQTPKTDLNIPSDKRPKSITVICGAFMLKGKNWARLLYTTWGILSFVFSLATSPVKTSLIPSLLVFSIILFYLFRPRASEYFKAAQAK